MEQNVQKYVCVCNLRVSESEPGVNFMFPKGKIERPQLGLIFNCFAVVVVYVIPKIVSIVFDLLFHKDWKLISGGRKRNN